MITAFRSSIEFRFCLPIREKNQAPPYPSLLPMRVERGDPLFAASVVGVGALGIVSSLTLATVDEFDIAQWVFEDMLHKKFVRAEL